MLQKIFIFVAALAICVLLVLDTVALLGEFGGEEAKAIVGSIGTSATGSPAASKQNNFPASQSESKGAALTGEPDVFLIGKYFHELGEYGFGNTMLVPNIVFNADGTFVFSENTGSGMGSCGGVYSLSSDGTLLTCNVTTADIACPDVITFQVHSDNALVLEVSLKKSVASDSFILRTEE